jgi:N-6 DNA Methylase
MGAISIGRPTPALDGWWITHSECDAPWVLLVERPRHSPDETRKGKKNIVLPLEIRLDGMWKRWPDDELERCFASHRRRLDEIAAALARGRTRSDDCPSPFMALCQELLAQHPEPIAGENQHEGALRSTPTRPPLGESVAFAYRMACSLGMLMHYSFCDHDVSVMINRRRPSNGASSYPNSPLVALLAAEYLIDRLLTEPIPQRIAGPGEARGYARSALGFRILDPSMECGELLLATIIAVVARILESHEWQSPPAKWLVEAMVRRLCRSCLYGIDLDPKSLSGTAVGLRILGRLLGIPDLRLTHGITGDSIVAFLRGDIGQFDAVINNPPWGDAPPRRDDVRAGLRCLEHHPDSYMAFLELAINSLRPGGVFGLIVPSQVIASRNAAGAREILAQRTRLERVVVLPRAAFAHATVRGAILLGQAMPGADQRPSNKKTRIQVFAPVRRLGQRASISTTVLPQSRLRMVGRTSWLSLIREEPTTLPADQSIRLSRLATVTTGIRLYRSGCSDFLQAAGSLSAAVERREAAFGPSTSVVRGRDIRPYEVAESQLKWSLADPPLPEVLRHTRLSNRKRVYVRELCRRDGRIYASTAPRDTLPLHGVLTVVPFAITLEPLIALLNSSLAARLVRARCASFLKVDFQRITASELESFPVHLALVPPRIRIGLGLWEPDIAALHVANLVVSLAGRLARLRGVRDGHPDLPRIDRLIDQLYGLEGCQPSCESF